MIMSDPIVIFEIIGNLLMSWWLGHLDEFHNDDLEPSLARIHKTKIGPKLASRPIGP